MYIVNILITGHTESEHVANVEKALERLPLAGKNLDEKMHVYGTRSTISGPQDH